MRKQSRSLLLRATALASVSLGVAAAPAFAQDSDEESSDRIVVTGSRLNQANITSSSPVLTVDSQAFIARGTIDAVDLVNTLPAAVADETGSESNGANGTSTLNLRGLGETRTLVLVDGKRLPAGRANNLGADGNDFASDINIIPAPLIERVEIVTGGASAVYGSDALGGVANFILRRDFEGLELNATTGFYHDTNNDDFIQGVLASTSTDGVVPTGSVTDGRTIDVSGIFGTGLDNGRGNMTGYIRYVDQRAIEQGSRDISRCATSQDFVGDQFDGGAICLGSNFGPFPTTISLSPIVGDDGLPLNPQPGTPGNLGTISLDAAGLIPRDADGNVITGASNAFNFNPLNFFRRPTTRWNAGFMAHYDINESIEAYLDFGYTDNITQAQIAPTGTFGEVQEINCDNPFLSAELLDVICTDRGLAGGDLAPVQINRRNVEGGGRNTQYELTNMRLVGGFRGELADNWEYDVFGQFAVTRQTDINTQDWEIDLLNEALQAVDDGNGNIVCTSGRAGCIPLNLFGTTPVDPDAIAAISVPTILTGRIEQTILGGTLQTDLGEFGISSPFADEGPLVLGGLEYRKDDLVSRPDAVLGIGNSTGLGGANTGTEARTTVWEIFGEAAIPLVQGAPFAEEISLSGAYRYSDYGAVNLIGAVPEKGGEFTTDAYSAGLSWAPVSDIRVRAQYQRAVRAPNVFNLFATQSEQLFGDSDPCSGATPTATLERCVASGLNPALFGLVPPDAGQLQQLTGGNPDLQPELSDTITLGAVFQPSQIPGLTLSIDYFDIDIEDYITTIPGADIVSGCLEQGNDDFCALFNRDQLGSIQIDGNVSATNQNIASFTTSGIDIEARYQFDAVDFGLPNVGGFNVTYAATWLDELTFQSLPTSTPFDCAGFVAGSCDGLNGNPVFEYSHNLSVGWQSNFDVDVRVLWRHLGPVDVLPGDTFSFTDEFEAENYLDLFASYHIRDNVDLNVGINNVFANDAPIDSFNLGNGNTYPSVYDAIGRYVFFGARVAL